MIFIISVCPVQRQDKWLQSVKEYAGHQHYVFQYTILKKSENYSFIVCYLSIDDNTFPVIEHETATDVRVLSVTHRDTIRFLPGDESFIIKLSAGSPHAFYYSHNNGFFECSTDIRYFSYLGQDLHKPGIYALLKYGSVPSPASIYERVFSLPRGYSLKVDSEGITELQCIYKPPNRDIRNEKSALKSVAEHLDTGLSLLPDEPLLFFSGGVDSSLLAARLKSIGKNPLLLHFSFGDNDEETSNAKNISRHLSLEMHEVRVSPEDYLSFFSDIRRFYHTPFADASVLPTWVMVRFAAENFPEHSVYVEGTAADGIFGIGNQPYHEIMLSRLPSVLRKAISVYHKYGPAWKYDNSLSKLGRFQRENEIENHPARRLLMQNSLDGLAYSIPYEYQLQIFDYMNTSLIEPVKDRAIPEIISYADITHVCAGIYAQKSYTAAAGMGKKIHFPFLEESMLSFIFSLETELKIKNGQKKYILKKLLSRHIPDDLIYRKKAGFRPPLQEILRFPSIQKIVENNVINPGNRLFDFVDENLTTQMIKRALQGKLTNKETLNYVWSFIFLSLWMHHHSKN